MDIKNSIDQNRLKKFMQVDVDVECMYIIFGGHGLSDFGDLAPFVYFQNGLY